MIAHKKSVVLQGDTQASKDALKALGGSWNSTLKGWCFPGSKKNDVLAEAKRLNSNVVDRTTADEQGASKENEHPADGQDTVL